MERDIDWVKKTVGGEMDILMKPGENRFRSLRWDLNDLDPQDVSCGNWGVWAFRGKRLVFLLRFLCLLTDKFTDMRLRERMLNKKKNL
jgi:hypothetical protein